MPNFQDTFGTCKQSFITAFPIFMTVPLNMLKYTEGCLVDLVPLSLKSLTLLVTLCYKVQRDITIDLNHSKRKSRHF